MLLLLLLILLLYIIVHGIAQHNGKQTGTTAAPDLLELFDLLSASYSYLPLPLAHPPWMQPNFQSRMGLAHGKEKKTKTVKINRFFKLNLISGQMEGTCNSLIYSIIKRWKVFENLFSTIAFGHQIPPSQYIPLLSRHLEPHSLKTFPDQVDRIPAVRRYFSLVLWAQQPVHSYSLPMQCWPLFVARMVHHQLDHLAAHFKTNNQSKQTKGRKNKSIVSKITIKLGRKPSNLEQT